MNFEVKIQDRPVLASGMLVLHAADREVTFELDRMTYILRFFPSAGPEPFRVSFDRRDQTHLAVDTHGFFPAGTMAWTLGGLLQLSDHDIDLDLMVYSQSAEPACARRVTFTFTARPKTTAPPPSAPIHMA